MADLSPVPAPKDASSFANLLATFTGAARKSNGMWDDSALLDDVATISYEQALRTHRRVPAAELTTAQLPEQIAPLPKDITPLVPVPDVGNKKRKTASITIRLTQTEEAQLHERAAAAELSVSAYLRSCIFEAESLRSQVKEALSHMKTASVPSPQGPAEIESNSRHNWRDRFLPRWSQPRASR
ncbi:MAG: hypothetical protein WBQ95_04545 [Terracidiphilus sp.]